MTNGRNTNAPKVPQWMLIFMLGTGSGGVGNWTVSRIDPPRPDPFTGRQGVELQRQIARNQTMIEQLTAENKEMKMSIGRPGQSVEHDSIVRNEWRIQNLTERMLQVEATLNNLTDEHK